MAIRTGLNLAQKPNERLLLKNKKRNQINLGQNVNFRGAGKLKIRDSYFKDFKNWLIVKNFDKIAGAITATISVVGFGVGGTGLIYDSMVKKSRHKNKHQDHKLEKKAKPEASITSEQVSSSGKSHEKKKGKSHEGEYGHIVPETEFGKTGLLFAKAALAVSGTAGFLTGVALRVPLMSAGEVIGNLLAAPIITTPAGYGLMSIGMATLLSGRALENNISLKLNDATLSHKKGLDKVKYIFQNIGAGLNDTAKTIGFVGSQAANLLSRTKGVRDEAKHFFKNKFFKIRSSTITMTQKVLANGETVVESGIKTHSYRLHTCAGLLAIGGALLAIEDLLERVGVIKGDKARKACFNVAKAGQYADNIGLVTYGLERAVKGAPILGIPVVLSGATALSGAHKVDKDEGKGIIWAALSFFFLLLALERGIESGVAIKARKKLKDMPIPMKEEFSDFAKTFEIDLSKIGKLTKKQLDNILKLVGGQEKAWINFKQFFKRMKHDKAEKEMAKIFDKAAKEATEALENDPNKLLSEVPRLVKVLKEKILAGSYNHNFSVEDLIQKLQKEGFSNEFISHIMQKGVIKIGGEVPDIGAVLSSIHKQNAEQFGKNYILKLDEIINNPASANFVKEAARKAKLDFAKLLEK